MPADAQIVAPAFAWVLITSNDVSSITFQNLGNPCYVRVTVGAVPPPAGAAGILYATGEGESSRPLSEIAPGVTGGNRVYARGDNGLNVWVSHA